MSKSELSRIKVKTLDNQLAYILEKSYELSPKIAQSIVETVNEVYDLKHYDPSQKAAKGEIVRTVISKKAKHGPVLEKLAKVKVTLTKEITKEDKKLYREQGNTTLRQIKILRLTDEALEQNGLLTQEDLADILEVSTRTIRRDIKILTQEGFEVSTRGSFQDIGPGKSHKTKIIELYLAHYTYTEIKIKTRHSPQAIKRYIKGFASVLLAIKNGLSLKEIAHVVGISERLAKEYTELYLEYNTKENQGHLTDIITRVHRKSSAKAEAKKGGQQ